MAKRNTPIVRIDPDFFGDMKSIARIRLDNGLAKDTIREISPAEMTRLLRRTNGYKMSLDELRIKPKKRVKW